MSVEAASSMELTSSITAVTIFGHGAEIKRHASFTPSTTGECSVRLTLPVQSAIDARSARAALSGPASLIETFVGEALVNRHNALEDCTDPEVVKIYEEIKAQLAERAKVEGELEHIRLTQEALERFSASTVDSESGLLAEVASSDYAAVFDKVNDLHEELATKEVDLRSDELEVLCRKSELDRQISKLVEDLRDRLSIFIPYDVSKPSAEIASALKTALTATSAVVNQSYIELKVDVLTSHTLLQLEVTYIVFNASWRPAYELKMRSSDIGRVDVRYFGVVSQQTGECWSQVKLTLQTGQPLQTQGHPPPLPGKTVSLQKEEMHTMSMAQNMMAQPMMLQSRCLMSVPAGFSAPTAPRRDGQAAQAAYDFTRVFTVASDPSSHWMEILETTLPVRTVHYAVPEMSKEVFRTGLMTNTSKHMLLESSEANVYWDNAFVMQAHLPTAATNETVRLCLGTEQSVKLEVSPTRSFRTVSGLRLIGQNVKEVTERKFVLRNLRADAVMVLMPFSVPQSSDAEIKVNFESPSLRNVERVRAAKDLELLDNGDVLQLTSSNAQIKWMLNETTKNCIALMSVAGSDTVKGGFSYSVERPADREVYVRQD